MKISGILGTTLLAGAGLLLYGAIVEVDRLKLERIRLRLRGWPRHLDGFQLGFIADLHLRDAQTISLAKRAIWTLLEEAVDFVAIGGDFVSTWKPASVPMLGEVLEPLVAMEGRVVGVPGNRDYYGGDPEFLRPILDELNIKLLRNEVWHRDGINWLGVDSANEGQADPIRAMEQVDNGDPIIALWHEPDLVDWLPEGCDLMLSGHSHGGQFTTPWGWAPVTSRNGRKYMRGYYPNATTPLYVSRGLGTTGPPSRLFCPPEVTILTLESE